VHEGTRSPRYGVLCCHTHIRNSKLKRTGLDSFRITLGASLRYVFKKLNLLGMFFNQWREKNRRDFRKGTGSNLGVTKSPSQSVPLAPLDVQKSCPAEKPWLHACS